MSDVDPAVRSNGATRHPASELQNLMLATELRTADEIDPDVPNTTGRDDNVAGDPGGRTNNTGRLN